MGYPYIMLKQCVSSSAFSKARKSWSSFFCMVVIVELLALAPTTHSALTVYEDDFRPQRMDSATLKYFGRQTNEEVAINASVIFLNEVDICNPPQALVQDKIVVSDMQLSRPLSPCRIGEVYRRLNKKGAHGLVLFNAHHPAGFNSFYHDSWDVQKYKYDTMLCVEVSVYDATATAISRWSKTSMLGATASFSGPHHHEWANLFTSTLWLVPIRVFVPLCNAHAAMVGLMVAWRNLHLPHAYSAFFTIVASFGCIVLGISALTGTFGPTMLPSQYHDSLFGGCIGLSVWTTLIMGLHMHEEDRNFDGLERRPVMVHRRSTIVSTGALFVGSDIIHICMKGLWWMLSGMATKDKQEIALIVFARIEFGRLVFVMCIGQLVFAFFFVQKSRKVNRKLAEYFRMERRSESRDRAAKSMERIRFWALTASVAMVTNALLAFAYAAYLLMANRTLPVWRPLFNVHVVFVCFFLHMASRTLTLYAQIEAVKASSEQPTAAIYCFIGAQVTGFFVRCVMWCCCRRKKTRRVRRVRFSDSSEERSSLEEARQLEWAINKFLDEETL